jgi:flagellar protein FliO/FliZ
VNTATSTAAPMLDLPNVAFSLLVVLGTLFALAWFARRLRGIRAGNGPRIEILSETPLGPKERVVLLQVEGQRVLVGVGSGQLSALHVLPPIDPANEAVATTAAVATATPTPPSFRDLLMKGLGR